MILAARNNLVATPNMGLYNCNKVDQVSENVVGHLFIEDFRSLTVSRITTLNEAQLIFGTKAFTD